MVEHTATELSHLVRQLHDGQRIAVMECVVADDRQAVGEAHIDQPVGVFECIIRNSVDAHGNVVFALSCGGELDRTHLILGVQDTLHVAELAVAVSNINVFQAVAMPQRRILTYAHHVLGNGDFRQAVAILECTVADGRQAVGQRNLRHILAAVESKAAGARHALLHHDGGNLISVVVPGHTVRGIVGHHGTRAGNGQNAIRRQRPGQIIAAGAANGSMYRRIRQRRVVRAHSDLAPLLFRAAVVHIGQVLAAAERIVPNTNYAVANRHRGQADATVERIAANARHAAADLHFGQSEAIGKRTVSNANYTVGNGICTTLAGRILDQRRHVLVEQNTVLRSISGVILRYCKRGQAGAIVERIAANTSYTAADRHRGQAVAIGERIFLNANYTVSNGICTTLAGRILDQRRHVLVEQDTVLRSISGVIFRYCNRGQAVTPCKRTEPKARHTVTNRHRSQAVAIGERPVPNANYAATDLHRGQALAVFKRIASNVRHAVANRHKGQIDAITERRAADARHTIANGNRNDAVSFAVPGSLSR